MVIADVVIRVVEMLAGSTDEVSASSVVVIAVAIEVVDVVIPGKPLTISLEIDSIMGENISLCRCRCRCRW